MTTENKKNVVRFDAYNTMKSTCLSVNQKQIDKKIVTFDFNELKALQNQSQVFDAIKRFLQKDELTLDFIAVNTHRLLLLNCFSNYNNQKQLMKRATAHYAKDNRHTEQRFVKRNITLDAILKR
jgi:hypothetical protein